MTIHHTDFAARISRIEQGIGSAKTTLYVGPDDAYQVVFGNARHAKHKRVPGTFQNLVYPLTILTAFAVGMLANLCVRWISFYSDLPPPNADNIDYMLTMDFVIAMMASSIIGVFFRFGIRDHIGLRVGGILAGMVGMHNLVHMYPSLFEHLFSPAWVGTMIGNTEPASLLVRGVSIAF
jgi:hypothetical protein